MGGRKMNILSWFKLLVLEQKLNFGAFGRYNRYRRWCLERNAKTAAERLAIADEVLSGPSVNTMEAQANELYLRRHAATSQKARKTTARPPKNAPAVNQNPELHGTGF